MSEPYRFVVRACRLAKSPDDSGEPTIEWVERGIVTRKFYSACAIAGATLASNPALTTFLFDGESGPDNPELMEFAVHTQPDVYPLLHWEGVRLDVHRDLYHDLNDANAFSNTEVK